MGTTFLAGVGEKDVCTDTRVHTQVELQFSALKQLSLAKIYK